MTVFKIILNRSWGKHQNARIFANSDLYATFRGGPVKLDSGSVAFFPGGGHRGA
jgi:hypothetical protein